MSRFAWGRQENLPEKESHELKDVEFSKKEMSVLGRELSWARPRARESWKVLETWSGLVFMYHHICEGTVGRMWLGPNHAMHKS